MGVLSAFFDVVAGVSILAGRSSLLDTRLTSVGERNLTIRTLLGLGFFGIGFVNILATSRRQKKIDRLAKGSETFGAEYCEECSYMEHDACPMIEGCPCCDNTRQGMMGAETEIFASVSQCDNCTERNTYSYSNNDEREGEYVNVEKCSDGFHYICERCHDHYGENWCPECNRCGVCGTHDNELCKGCVESDDGESVCVKCCAEQGYEIYHTESFEEWSQPCHCGEGTLRQEGDEDDLWVVIWCDTCSFSQDIKMKEAESFEAQSVMRTYKGRKGPAISAKAVRVGTRKRGNDGRMWQVRRAGQSQRWFRD